MKAFNTIVKIAAALVVVAGIALVVYKFWDKIMEKLGAAKGKCCCDAQKESIEEASAEEAEQTQEEATEEAPAEEAAPADAQEVTEADFAD